MCLCELYKDHITTFHRDGNGAEILEPRRPNPHLLTSQTDTINTTTITLHKFNPSTLFVPHTQKKIIILNQPIRNVKPMYLCLRPFSSRGVRTLPTHKTWIVVLCDPKPPTYQRAPERRICWCCVGLERKWGRRGPYRAMIVNVKCFGRKR